MARVVHPCVTDVGSPEQRLPVEPVAPGIDGTPVSLAEDEALVLPDVPCRHPLFPLAGTMCHQAMTQWPGKLDRPSTGSALGFHENHTFAPLTLQCPADGHGSRL